MKVLKESPQNNTSYQKRLSEIINVLQSVAAFEAIPGEAESMIDHLEGMASMLKDTCLARLYDKSRAEMEDKIDYLYANNRAMEDQIEEFLLSHGASTDNATIFEGVSDDAIKELYRSLVDELIKTDQLYLLQ